MSDIFGRLEAEWHEHRHHDAPQHPQAPATPHNGPQEAPMSLHAEIEADARALAVKAEALDHRALDVLDAVQANPATAEAFTILGQLTHLPPEALATGTSVLRMILQAAAPAAPVTQYAPAGPVVGGQA